ncbi:B-cell receptor-associated 31-like [Striga hermonthica]|uniref:Endoplasmic reticulum transmembrane protein n=1 Tax=Striga hermonthica TaxID=68872 RepID=A0A9N7NIZ6_STRHE|nr:B-cell receptor-associated 31-like [Striga hermonthica]
MALQWAILAYVVATEAAVAILLTLPSPKALKSRIVSLISLVLQPSLFIIPFSTFQLLDIYWKNEHRLMCTGEICTAAERDRYEKSIYKSQRNAVLCTAACLLYWCIYRICKYHREIQSIEEIEKRYKDE